MVTVFYAFSLCFILACRLINSLYAGGLYMYQLKTKDQVSPKIVKRFLEGDGSPNTGIHFTENLFYTCFWMALFCALMAYFYPDGVLIYTIIKSVSGSFILSGITLYPRQAIINYFTRTPEENKKEMFFGIWIIRIKSQKARLILFIVNLVIFLTYVLFFGRF